MIVNLYINNSHNQSIMIISQLTQAVILNGTKWSEESRNRAKKKFLDSSPDNPPKAEESEWV